MAPGLRDALAALLLEHADLRAARLAVDHAEHLGAGHERRAGQHFAAVLLDEQHLVEGDPGPAAASMRSTATTAPGSTLTWRPPL